ncbi:malectin domain-containing carbohydrate-binding protein [Lentzea sp. DG1S-22]|uniref:malectin domain-containing carbohydrate-binding protein n=1 Tax=Lentzea sp. DG1S-22 TaxID=3108822 RepID=UPI002E76A8A8|nr:malectin domain-containing carbohydrate-binding protein [Lentzea sp. DG1S-22]WVH83051.1 malectin domain-containing carbohydrate-binding protein [Lentzea sp. DG1S-22]
MRNFTRVVAATAAAAALLLGTAQVSLAADPVVVDAGGPGDIGVGGLVDTKPADKRSNVVFSRTVRNRIDSSLWNTSRYLESSYELTGLTAGASYELRLYFLDWYFTRPGQRIFDVDVNGQRVLSDFDIVGTAVAAGADAPLTAFGVEKDFAVTADADGKVRVGLVRGAVNQPQINAIVLVPAA